MPLRSPEDALAFASKHRVKTRKGWTGMSALVGRTVGRNELTGNTKTRAAMTLEHEKLPGAEVWLKHKPREWPQVAAEVSSANTKAHVW
mgnify:CR=1 FL=1